MRTRPFLLARPLAAVLLLAGLTAYVPAAAAEPGDGTWSANMTPPVHLWSPSLVPLPDGRIFAVGQRLTPTNPPYNNVQDAGNAAYFDPATDTFQRVADLGRARVGQAVALPDGRIAAFGGAGLIASQQGCPGGVGEYYDPASNTWTPIPTTAGFNCISGVVAAALPDGRVLVHAQATGIWDPATNTVTRVAGPEPTYVWSLEAVGGKVYGAGQWPTGGGGRPQISAFDPATATWTRGSDVFETADSKRQNVLVVDATTLAFVSDNDAHLIDTTTLAATRVEMLPGSRPICAAGVLAGGYPIALGCGPAGPGETSEQVLDPATGSWRALPEQRPDLHRSFLRSVTVPSGTYFVGLNASFDGFVFVRYVPTPAVVNAAPVASDQARSVRGDRPSGVVLSASDADGDALGYTVTSGPDHGVLTGDAPDLTYTPTAGYRGPDELTFQVDDGNGGTDSATVALTVTDPTTGSTSLTQEVAPGQSVSTGTPTAQEPSQVAITSPAGGTVVIADDPSVADPADFQVLGAQYRIEAPDGSAADPLRLTFRLATTAVPAGEDPLAVAVFRNGAEIVACADASGRADPEPCVAERAVADGVLTLTVLSAHASDWTLGLRRRTTTTVLAAVPGSTYGEALTLSATVDQPGAAVPTGTVEFRDLTGAVPVVLGTATVGTTGVAALGGIVLPAGTRSLVAAYSGSAAAAPSTSSPVAAVVARAPVVVVPRTVSLGAALRAGRFTYSATVTSRVTGLPVAGAVTTFRTVLLNGAVLGCTALTDAQGTATCTNASGAGIIAALVPARFDVAVAATANYLAGTATGRYGP